MTILSVMGMLVNEAFVDVYDTLNGDECGGYVGPELSNGYRFEASTCRAAELQWGGS